jgi:acyl carrier protein
MTDQALWEITDQDVLTVVRRSLRRESDRENLTIDANLWELGMDSLTGIAIVAELEGKYGIEIPDDVIQRDMFGSVAAIAAAVRNLTSADADGKGSRADDRAADGTAV